MFLGRLSYLADHLLPCGPVMAEMTHADKTAMLQERLRPIAAVGKAQEPELRTKPAS